MAAVLEGKLVKLRLVRDDDVAALYEAHQDIANRGDFYPTGVKSLPAFRKAYDETGFWEENEGTLVIAGTDDAILGHIEYFPTVAYLDELEVGYILYSRRHDGQGRHDRGGEPARRLPLRPQEGEQAAARHPPGQRRVEAHRREDRIHVRERRARRMVAPGRQPRRRGLVAAARRPLTSVARDQPDRERRAPARRRPS